MTGLKEMRMKTLCLTCAFGALLGQAQATVLVPGGTVYYPFSLPGSATFAYGTFVDYQSTPFASVPAGLSGVLESWVYNNGGTMDFWYKISNSSPVLNIHRFVVNGFEGFTTDVDFDLGSTGNGPASIDRSPGAGATVGFSYVNGVGIGGEIAPGFYSKYLFVRTNSTTYADSTASVIDGFSANLTDVFAPVPEPASMAALALGVVALLRRRRS